MSKGILFAALAFFPFAATVGASKLAPAAEPIASSTSMPAPKASPLMQRRGSVPVAAPTIAPPTIAPKLVDKHAAPYEVREGNGAIPKSLALTLHSKLDGMYLEAQSGDAIVMLRRGDQRVVHTADVEVKLDEADDTPIIAEVTPVATMETTRAIVRAKWSSHGWVFDAIAAAPPEATSAHETKHKHACVSQRDGFGGFTVICRVATGAGATNVTDADVTTRVVTYVRSSADDGSSVTLVRMDFDAKPGTVDASILGYSDAGTGVLVRAEMSWFPDEKAPTLTLVSGDRTEPVLIQRIRRWRKIPEPLMLDDAL